MSETRAAFREITSLSLLRLTHNNHGGIHVIRVTGCQVTREGRGLSVKYCLQLLCSADGLLGGRGTGEAGIISANQKAFTGALQPIRGRVLE